MLVKKDFCGGGQYRCVHYNLIRGCRQLNRLEPLGGTIVLRAVFGNVKEVFCSFVKKTQTETKQINMVKSRRTGRVGLLKR